MADRCKFRVLAIIAAFLAAMLAGSGTRAGTHSIRLNPAAFDHAATLIGQGQFVIDKRSEWAAAIPSNATEKEFVRLHPVDEYGKWYLGVDSSHRPGARAHYRFPFGDFERVHRSGLIAIVARARQYGYDDIAQAALQLQQMIEARELMSPTPSGKHR